MEDTKLSLCPICMGPLEFPRNLCNANYKNLLELLHRLLGFQVEIHQGLFNICRTCEGKLVWVSEFKDLCEKSLERFKNIDCKKEFIDLDDFALSLQNADLGLNSDSDSDNRPLIVRKKRKKILKRSPRSFKKRKVEENDEYTTGKRCTRLKQYSSEKVLEAISDNKISTDPSNRSCLHCDYVSSAGLLCHMQSQHENLLRKWCQDCNEQTSNLKKHQDIVKCNEFRCKFCAKRFSNRDFLTRHLRTHCHEAFTSEKSENEEEQNIDCKEDLKSEVDNSVKEGIEKSKDNAKEQDLEDAFNSGIDSDYTPDRSDSDSDFNVKLTRSGKKIVKPLTKRKIKPREKCTTEKSVKERKRNSKYSKQYSETEVLEAIAQFESYMTDIKNRKCIHCEYNAVNAKSLRMHMTFKHKAEFRTWCKHCNIQTDNLQTHRESTKCYQELCKFCNKISPSQKNFAQHLRSHCQKVKDNKPLEEARWKACEQYPKEKVFEAISICTNYMTDIKNRTCLFCDYTATTAKTLTVHLRFGHKENFDTWCGRCNLQTDNLKLHTETTKCFENRCTLCNKKFTKINRLTRHLESHCRDAFKKPGENSDWEDDLLPMLESAPPSVNPVICELASSQNPEDNSSTFWFPTSDKIKVQSNTNGGFNIKDEEAINEMDERDLHDSDADSQLNSQDECGDAKSGKYKYRKSRKIINNTPLKQFPQNKVERAIKESMRSFYTSRKCIKCGFLTSNSKCLGAHMATHKNLKDKWCSRCNALVANLKKHWTSHKNDILKCIFCGRSSESVDNLKDHLKRHCRNRSLDCKGKWFSCKGCPSSFPEEQQLKSHECTGINTFETCTLCAKQVRNLRIHMSQRHKSLDSNLNPKLKDSGRKRLCPICGKTFMLSYLAAHMYTHTGEMPFKCSFCGKGFAIMSILRSHEKRHKGEKPFVCHICGKGFVTSSEHRSHSQIHEGGPVQCTICNKEFNRPGVLKLHMRRHTGENQFYCVHCGVSFHRKSLLQNHMRRHNNDRPYKCSFCEKDFRDPSTLRKHEHIHKGIKPYKCSICSFSCTQSQGLSLHMKQHPEDAPQADRPYKCFFCYRQFNTNAMLMSHTNNHHRNATR